jgi:hypothetical protein
MTRLTRPALVLAALGCLTAFAAERPALPDLPQAVSSLGATVCDGWLYVYGGHTGKTHQYSTETVSGRFHRLKLDGGTAWEELPGGPGLQGMNLASAGGKVYRVGGMQPRNKPGEPADNHSVADAAVYDPAVGRWEALPPLPEPRSSHDLVALDGKLYVVGGWVMRGQGQKSLWPAGAFVLDLARPGVAWQPLPQPFQRRALTAAAHAGKVYVLAGLTADGEMDLAVNVFDPAAGTWTGGPKIPGPIGNGFSPAACSAGGRLYLSAADGKCWQLAAAGDAWEPVGALKQPRIVHRLVPAAADRLVAVGGASRQGNVALTEVFSPTSGPTPAAPAAALASGQKVCPVMTSEPVDGDSPTVEYQGVKVSLCCSACARKWAADPAAYLDAKLLPQLAHLELPPRVIAQRYCPVYPTRVVSSKDPAVTYKGQTVYLFNASARAKFEADPAKYADPKLLPQLGDAR